MLPSEARTPDLFLGGEHLSMTPLSLHQSQSLPCLISKDFIFSSSSARHLLIFFLFLIFQFLLMDRSGIQLDITLIASPSYSKSRYCDQVLLLFCKNMTKRAHAQPSTCLGTFFRARSKVRRLNVNETLFYKDDNCLLGIHSPTIKRCLEDFQLRTYNTISLVISWLVRWSICLLQSRFLSFFAPAHPSKPQVKKPVR